MEYKRLTCKNAIKENCVLLSEEFCMNAKDLMSHTKPEIMQKAIDRLAELEDKIENRTLIELPCKVGDKVFSIWAGIGQDYTIKDDIVWYLTVRHNLYITTDYIEDGLLGAEVFLTKEQAEAKLKELKEKK